MSDKSNLTLRRIVLFSLILSFAILSTIFIYQYLQYKKVEGRLNAAYSSGNLQSPALYKLFSTFTEADNLFRLYTINFDENDFTGYRNKLDTIKLVVDSLAALPIDSNPINSSAGNSITEGSLALQYAHLKKQVDDIVYYAQDSLQTLTSRTHTTSQKPRITQSDSIISKILRDTLKVAQEQDTVVKKKEGLFNRIFKAKNDTLVNQKTNEVLNVNQIDLVQRNIDQLISTNERIYRNNLRDLRAVFGKLQEAEKELITSNYALLNSLKIGIENLRQIELDGIRQAEEQDFALYKENSTNFGNQLIIALAIMLLMIVFLVYYQYQVASYERKLLNEKEYASKIAEEKTNVLANISHEVRSPLVSLQGVVNILKNNNDAKTIDKEIIQTIDNDINVINSTVNDILNLSKLEAGSLDIKFGYISPYKLIEDSIGLHQYQAETKKLELINANKVAPQLMIWGNAFRFKQVISNLISNAIKYTQKGSITVTAEVKKVGDKQRIVIRVIDTGIGISDNKKDQIFRKYYIADNKNKSGGFGLGLYISKILSEQIKGSISFISEAEKGTTFIFEVPIEKSHMEANESQQLTVSSLPQDIRIVFIDDSRIGLFFIQQLFNNHQNVRLFDNSQQAWAYLASNPVDIVVTDLIMPELDGWGILNRIRSTPAIAHTKVFVCTAENMLLEGKSNQKYSFDGTINKPINENNLVATLLKG
ncbi:ATP-binding response regulator [Sphingobacterium yanglingense]|uniref:histidine kinase n=1 Tax=Sphingobacterium yanglingense TaxID=1437280 RepID=A0A4R6WMG6_9SPHI|nr:hybrid sensor histidine kinase/response regulator [Sphingobacterium yanglingense]TDQ79982.1 phospho-acceptor domain-containing protein [Sphingobacterium yanglingense]